jgi:hypothetical protein
MKLCMPGEIVAGWIVLRMTSVAIPGANSNAHRRQIVREFLDGRKLHRERRTSISACRRL